MADYAPVGFHFKVDFLLPGLTANDVAFQEVNGLSVEVETEDYAEGGENRFVHTLPVKTKYANLELKRGLLLNSGISRWIKNSLEQFIFFPTNLVITLLNENHKPLAAWSVIHAIPLSWSVDSFNAMESKIVVESITLSYQYWVKINIT